MITIVLSILAYILGPILVITWAVKRFKSGKHPEFIELVAVAFAVGMLGLITYSYMDDVGRDDNTEMSAIMKDVVARYDFPVKAKFLDKPAVFIDARGHSYNLKIYGVSDDQQKIKMIVKKIRRQIASKPIVIYFMQDEVWLEADDGTRKPLRDNEIQLRRIRLEWAERPEDILQSSNCEE